LGIAVEEKKTVRFPGVEIWWSEKKTKAQQWMTKLLG